MKWRRAAYNSVMRLAGKLSAVVLTVLMMVGALLYGADFFLHYHGEQIGGAIERHFPGVKMRFAAARLRLGWGQAAIYVDDMQIGNPQGSSLRAPKAELWWQNDGVVGVLYSPEIIIVRSSVAAISPLAAAGGNWAMRAHDAKVIWRDDGVSLTLHHADLNLRYEQGELRVQIDETHDNTQLRARARLHITDKIRGVVYAELEGWSPPVNEVVDWKTMRATVRATLNVGRTNFIAAGAWDGGATGQWHAIGDWDGEQVSLTLSATADAVRVIARAPPLNTYVRGTLVYRPESWQWRGEVLAQSDDGKARGTLVAHGAAAQIVDINANLQLQDIAAAELWKYMPSAAVRRWFADSLVRGQITNARMRVYGEPSQPNINLTAAFTDARILIGGDWPAAQAIDGLVVLNEADIQIFGDGAIGGVNAENVRAHLPMATAAHPMLFLDILFNRRPIQDYVAAARTLPPTREIIQSLAQQITIAGDSQLSLRVAVPLANPTQSDFDARLLILGDGVVGTKSDLPPLRAVAGVAAIDGDGVRATLHGQFLNHPATALVDNQHIVIDGRIAASVAATIAGFTDAPLAGAATFTLSRSEQQTVFVSDLRGVSIHLPPPLNKSADKIAPLAVTVDSAGVRADWRLDDNIFRVFDAHGTDIAINSESRLPPAAGVYLHGEIARVQDAAGWIAQSGGGGRQISMSLLISDSSFLNMHHDYLRLESVSSTVFGERRMFLDGDSIAGTVFYRDGGVRADLTRLSLTVAATRGGDVDMRQLTVDIAARDFSIAGRRLGALRLFGAPGGKGWLLHALQVRDGGNILRAGGEYDGVQTELTVALEVVNMPVLLSLFGQSNIISDGDARLTGRIFWARTPIDFSLGGLNGRLSLDAEDLRYLKSEEGLIGFFAIFSPESLLQLGFTEIVKKGININVMEGEISLSRGVAAFHNFNMENEDVGINLAGETDLQTQELDIAGRVRPGNRLLKASTATAIGVGIAAAPISLAAGWFLGKVFEQPLSEIGAYNYVITGTWGAPEYSEIGVFVESPPNSAR